MMKSMAVIVCMVLALVAVPAFAQNFVEPETLKQWLESGRKVLVVDLQAADKFDQRHIKGSLRTNAYSVETDSQKAGLEALVPMIMKSDNAVVLVHAPGKMGRIGGGRAYDFFMTQGVAESRLFILNGGIDNWTYSSLTWQRSQY